jgi:RNA polymerase sigma-70 factor (ECF subfamily)
MAPLADPLQLLAAARAGDNQALGALVNGYRNYLQLLARVQVDRQLRRRLSASDLVQETLTRACRGFREFRGVSEQELLAWLRTIMVHSLRKAVEREIKAYKRTVWREVPLHVAVAAMENSSAQLDQALLCSLAIPAEQAETREMVAVVADRLAQLPEQYREIIILRNLEGLRFDEVAQRLGKSVGAARVMWVRALNQLRGELDGELPNESA